MGERLKLTATEGLLEQVRTKLEGATDYAIGKKLGILRQRVSDYRKGDRQADAYACLRFAEVLERDPLEVIALVEADAAKTDERRAFWAGFPSGLRRTVLGVGFLAIAGTSALGLPRGAEAGMTSHNVRLRPPAKRKPPERAVFFWLLVSPMPAGKAGTAPGNASGTAPADFSCYHLHHAEASSFFVVPVFFPFSKTIATPSKERGGGAIVFKPRKEKNHEPLYKKTRRSSPLG